MPYAFKSLNAQTSQLLRQGNAAGANASQDTEDAQRIIPQAQWNLLWAAKNANALLDRQGVDDGYLRKSAESLRTYLADAIGNPALAILPLKAFNEGNLDFASGRDALRRMADLATRSAKADPNSPEEKAAAQLDQSTLDYAAARQSARQAEGDAFDQDRFDLDYAIKQGLLPEFDRDLLSDDERTRYDAAERYAREGQRTTPAEAASAAAQGGEDPRLNRELRLDLAQRERADLARIATERAARERLRARLSASMARASWTRLHDTLSPEANELISRAFIAGQAGLDIADETAAAVSPDNPRQTFTPTTPFAAGAESQHLRLQAQWESENGRVRNMSNATLKARLRPGEAETVRNLVGLARGVVNEPQWWSDMWTKLKLSADRTIGNPLRLIADVASDIGTPIGDFIARRDFDHEAYSEAKRQEIINHNLWEAATQPLAYDDYGFFLGGLQGAIEQLPIWGVLATGAVVSALTKSPIGLNAAQTFLALGYAQDTRNAAIEQGADAWQANLLGLTSGFVQGFLDRAQGEALVGKGFSEAYLKAALKDVSQVFGAAIARNELVKHGTARMARATLRFGGALALDGFAESVVEGTQAAVDRLGQNLALKLSGEDKAAFDKVLASFKEEFVEAIPTMIVTVGVAGAGRAIRGTAQHASIGKQIRILTSETSKQTLDALSQGPVAFAELRQRWRAAENDRSRVAILRDAGKVTQSQAETLHAYLLAEERIADRNDVAAMQLGINMASEAGLDFAADKDSAGRLARVLQSIGLKDVQIAEATLRTDADLTHKGAQRGWRVSFVPPGGSARITLALAVMPQRLATLDATASSATSALEYLKTAAPAALDGMADDAFIARWQADDAFRNGLIETYGLGPRGMSFGPTVSGGPVLTFVDAKGNNQTLSAAGLIYLATGGHGAKVRAANATLAHETAHAVVALLRETGALRPDDPLVKDAIAIYGAPRAGVDELFNEEALADALAREADLGLEAAEAAAGMLTRRRLGRVASAFRDLANWFLGNDDLVLSDAQGIAEVEGAGERVRAAASADTRFFAALTRGADEASRAFGALETARRDERLARLREQVRARRERLAELSDQISDAQTAEAHEQAAEETRRLLNEEDAILREQAQILDTQLRADLADTRDARDRARDAFADAWRTPLPEGEEATRLERQRRRDLLAAWRAAKDRELAILRQRAELGVDPDARREYLEAAIREQNRLDGRALRAQADAERAAIRGAAPSRGNALLGQTRILGHETIESREHYLKRQMAAHGWSRETAIAEATHLYPEDMQGVGLAPWAARALYAEGGTSPDAAAQAAHDAGRLPEPTVDAFWDAVRGDLAAVSQWKNREIDRIDAETTQAATFGGNQLRDALANLDTLDAQGRLQVGGVDPAATSAHQKDVHGVYPDLGDVIARARFSIGGKRKQEYRALIAKARPNLPQADIDAFMAEMDALNDTKKEKAALHWFVKGALILPEDRDKLDMAVRMSGKWHLDFQAFDTPAALINEANARAEAKKKKPAPAYLDPDTVPQLTNKRDLGHGVVIYDVEDSEAGQQAMRQIMNSHLGRNADGEFWSPWCLLTCSPKTGALSESARKYWEHYNKTGRAAAFHNGKLCAFQSSDTKRRKWWDLNDENHGTKIPLPLTITSAEMGYASDDIPGDIVIQNGYEMTKDGELVPLAKPRGRTFLVGTRGSIAEGKTEKWIFASRRVFKAETSLYKDGVLYKSVSSPNPAYTIIRFYSDGNQSVAQSSYVGSPYYDRTIKDSNGLTLREDRRLTEEEANQNPFDNPDWRSVTLRNGDRRTEYNGGTDWTYENFENGTRIFYAEYRDAGGRGRLHGRTEYIDDDTGALVTEYYDHGEQVNHPVVNERIVPGQGSPQPRRAIGGLYSGAPVAYDRPSLKAVGSGENTFALGWGLYAGGYKTGDAYGTYYARQGVDKDSTLLRIGERTLSAQDLRHDDALRQTPEGRLADELLRWYWAHEDPQNTWEERNAADVRRALQQNLFGFNPKDLPGVIEKREAELTQRGRQHIAALRAVFGELDKTFPRKYREWIKNLIREPYAAPSIHEQVWWTHRPEGDESHLLNWSEPITDENRARLLEAIDSLGIDPQKLEDTFGKDWRTRRMTGKHAYNLAVDIFRTLVKEHEGSPKKAASALLYAHGIDGVKSFAVGEPWYVAFSDEHLQVVRRWVWDPQTQDFALDTTFLPPTPAPRRSIGGWLDRATEAHLTAEREGDVETAQRLVHEAAERAGYRHQAAHGTGQFGFTVFDPNKSDDKRSLFFAGDPTLAATYQWQATDISGRGSANTAFRDVASTIRPLELDLNAEYPNDAAFIHAVTEAVERAGGTVAVGHLEPGSGKTVKVAPGEYIGMKPWPQDYILVTMPRSDGPKAFDVLTPDTMVREAKAFNAAKEGELRGYAARLKAEYEADPNGEYYGAFGRMSKKDRWLQAEHTLQTFLENPQPYLEDDSLTAAQANARTTIRMNWEFLRKNDSFGIYHVALRMDNPLVIDAQGKNWSAIDIKLPGSNRKHWKTRQLAEYAQTHGYDGVQINNVYDLGPNYIPGAGRKPSTVYIVFDGNQVKSLDPFTYDEQGNLIPLSRRFDTTQPDIRRSIGGRAPRGVPLTAYHALSQEQLLRSLRQGGLVAPSIAVTEAGKARAFGYGECFLFFRREAVDPQANPENFIFPGDAGTPIYPRRWPTQTSVDAVLRRVRALGPEWTATTREEILREAMRVYNVTNESFEDSGLVDVPNALYALYLAESSDGDITPTPDGTRDIARDLAREDPDGFLRVPDFWRWAKAQFKISTRALTPRQATRLMRLAPLKELSSLSPELGDEMTQFHDSAMLALRDIEETRKVIVHPYNVERGFDALKRAIRKPGVSAENSLRHLSADLSLVNTEAELRDLFSRENEWYATGERALNALLRYIRNASGMEEGSYFEAKPMRLVGIDEIRMALIPQNASAELRTALTESGIPYKTYTEGDQRRAIRDAAAQTRFSIGGVAPSATSARQKDAHGAYPDLGDVIAGARFSVGGKRKQEYRALIAKARPNLPQADIDAFMAEMDTLGDTKKEKAALHWFVKGALILPEETKTLGKALQVAEAFKIDPYRTDTPQEVLRIAATMAQDRSRELQGAFLRPEDIGLQLERDCGNGLKIYDVGETQQASVWRLMRSQGFIFVNPKTNKIIANSPWCLLTPTDSGSGPSQSAVAFWEGDPKATEEEINEDPYALGYTGIPKRAAFFRDRIVAFCADLNIDGYDRNRENWFDLNNDRVGQECEFFWEGTAEQMGLTHVPPETPVYVSGDESETEMTVGEEGSDVYEHYHDNELQESIVQPTLFPIAPFAKPRRQVGGNAPFNRADFVARATPIANDPNVKERSAHDFPIGDVPDALVRHGATPGGLLTTDGKIAKMARRHDLPPDRLADAIEAMNDPVAIFLEWEDAARGTIGLSVLTNILADDGEGRQAPVRLTLITRTDAPGMFLTSAYARKRSKEHNYVKVITNGGLLYVDEQRVAQLPLEDATVSACVPSNVRGDPSVGTVPNPGEEVKPGARLEVGGAERRLREANARVRTAALYYGRNPAVAEVANRAIAEIALFNEASRTGKKVSRETVKSAYADFGIQADDDDAAQIADRLNAMAKSERWSPRDKQGLSPRDALIPQERHLRATYDIHWSQAEKTAYTRGVEGAFGAARALARDAQEIAQTKRAEAEGVLGVAPALIEAELGFDIEASLISSRDSAEEAGRAISAAQRRERERERKRALEEAEQAMQAMEDGTASPEPTPESLGFTPEKLDALRKRRDELRKRLNAIERQFEAKRQARVAQAKKDKDGETEAAQEDADEAERQAAIRNALKGIAFDIDNPVGAREFVNLIILHIAERRLGRELKTRADTRDAFRDPLVVRDAARTLAQIADSLANSLAYGSKREHARAAADRLASAETIAQVRALATGALLALREARIRQTRQELRDDIVKAIDAVASRTPFSVGKEDSDRKVTGSLEQRLREIRRALLLGETARLRLRNAMTELLNGTRQDAAERGEGEDALADYRDYIDAQRTIAALNQAGDWRNMSLAQLAKLRDEVLALIEKGEDAHERAMAAFEDKCERLIQPILAALEQNPPKVKPGKHSKLSQRLAAFLDRNLGLQSLLFETLLANASGTTRAKAKAAIDRLAHLFSEAAVTYDATRTQWKQQITAIIEKHYGSTRAFNRRMDTVVPEAQRALISDRRTEAREQDKLPPPQRNTLTIGQVFQLYASAIQKDYAKNIRLHRRDGKSLEAMRQVLTDDDLAFLRDCSAFFRQTFPKLRDAYEAITGVRVGTTPDYWPVKIDYRKEGLQARVRAFTPIVSAMEPRRRNGLDFDENVDARDMLYGRLDDWAHMLGYGKLGLIARAVLGNRHIRREAQNNLGDKLEARLQQNIQDALLGPETKGGEMEGVLLRAARWTSYFALAGNIGSLIKQFAGIPAFALEMGIADTLKAAVAPHDDAWRADWQYLTQDSPAYDARYGSGLNAEMRQAYNDLSRGGSRSAWLGAPAALAAFGMHLQGWTDRLVAKPFAVHAYRAYRDAYLRQGVDEAEAKRRAAIDAWDMVERTQSSARPENQLAGVNRSRLARLFTQFLSSPLQQLQYETRAISACLKGEEGAKQRLIRALVINHVLTPLFWTALDAVVRGLLLGGFFDDDDEHKERLLLSLAAEATAGVVLGQGSAVPIFGWGAEWAIGVFLGAERPRQDDLAAAMGNIPAISTTARAAWFAGKVVRDAAAAPFSKETSYKDLLSDLDDILKATTPIYRQASQATKGWLGHDLDDWWED